MYVSQEWLQEHACPSRRCSHLEFWGWYNDEGTIYLWADAARGPEFDGVIVHELTHYLQHVKGTPDGQCPRERQSYSLQDRYLVGRGIMIWPRFSAC